MVMGSVVKYITRFSREKSIMMEEPVYTDFVQFKLATPVGASSKEFFEEMSNITVCHLSREDYNEYLSHGGYDMGGVVLMRLPGGGGVEKVVVKYSEHMSATVRVLFAENPECLKVTLVRRGESFFDDSAKLTVETLAKFLRARGVTVETGEGFKLPTPFAEMFVKGYSLVVMAALRMDSFVFPDDVSYSEMMPSGYESEYFDLGVKEKNLPSFTRVKQNPRLSDSNVVSFTEAPTDDGVSKTVKQNKKRARESFIHISVKDLITAGLIHPDREIRFKMSGLDENTQLPSIVLLPTGAIKVGDTITDVLSQAGQKIYDSLNRNIVCKSAWAQFEVKTPVGQWKPLKDIRQTYSDMLKIKGEANAKLVKQNLTKTSLKDIVEAKVLPTHNIHSTVRGVHAEGTITSEGNIIVNNVVYGSPTGALNGALRTLKGKSEPRYKDGWSVWLVKNANGGAKPLKYYKDMLK